MGEFVKRFRLALVFVAAAPPATACLLLLLLQLLFLLSSSCCATQEGDAIASMLQSLHYTKYNGTDPCTWDPAKIVCDPISGRITELHFHAQRLTGPLPAEIGVFTAATWIDLSYNSFSSLPDDLANLVNLQKLYLGNNSFTGPIPSSLGEMSNLRNLNVSGNCLSARITSETCPSNYNCRIYPSLFQNGEGLFKLNSKLFPHCFLIEFEELEINFQVKQNGDWQIPNDVKKYAFLELAKATDNFSAAHEIGAGGFGKVFCGTFDDGKMVAIKRARGESMQGMKEFRNEVLLLSRLHHRHLVKLEGFCDDKGLQILVYEFMKNGNLHDFLLDGNGSKLLSWGKRLEIAVGIAQGLDYLHSYADPPVIHRDVKPSNILLDENLIAKVSDFGISKENEDSFTHISTRPAGTAGYLDPEYFLRRQLTTASDVYGYGVLLLEIITGQQAIDHMRVEEMNLIRWVKPRFKKEGVERIVDPKLGNDYNKETMSVMTEVALMCAASSKNDRPSMKVSQVMHFYKSA
ncbi:unnamed protein product [Sphagnum jensenii]